jgi:hypothetical protein
VVLALLALAGQQGGELARGEPPELGR